MSGKIFGDSRASKETVKIEELVFYKCIMCDGARDCGISTYLCRCSEYDISGQDKLMKTKK